MWRSGARALLLRSSIRRHPPIQAQVSSETLTRASPPPISSKWVFQNTRLFCSATSPNLGLGESHDPSASDTFEVGIDGNGAFGENPGSISQESDAPSTDFAAGVCDDAGFAETTSWTFDNEAEGEDAFTGNPSTVSEESGAPSLDFDEDNDKSKVEGQSLSSLWEESISADDSMGIFACEEAMAVEAPEIDSEQLENVVSLLQSTLQEPLDLSLDKMDLTLSEEFVARVIQTPHVSGENLVGFFRWASQYDESVKTSSAIELLIRAVNASTDLSKKEAYVLWDLVKELGKEKGLLTTEILNQLISMFWKLGKAKAGLEVFEKFAEFGCDPDGNTYYFTIKALSRHSMLDAAWSVGEKMLKSGSFPDSEKIGEIITFFCKGKTNEAHLIYLKVKEKKICLPRSSLDFLINGLLRKDKTIRKALELLDNYSGESLKYANKTFASVVRGLCRIKDLQEAKKLLLRMVDSGPPPGNAAFNYVINALSKEGEMEGALALVKVMESRGLRPDVYTYTVIMSGFAKGGLMDEAYKIFCKAKERHPKLTPVTYHILTRGYCKMEEFDKALECLKEMKEDGLQPNADEYNKMIQSLCLKALDWRAAEKLLEELKESGLHLKGITRSLIAAVKELEQEEVPSEGDKLEA